MTRVEFDPAHSAVGPSPLFMLGIIPAPSLASELLRMELRSNEGRQLTRSTLEVAAEIKRYCAARPGARDTLEGIAWWLTMQRLSDAREELCAAVDFLVEQKVLVAYRLNDGTTVFGCATDEREKGCE